jgi:uncharacterized protein YraI
MKRRLSILKQLLLAPFFMAMLLLTACGVKQASGQISTSSPSNSTVLPTLAFPPSDTQTAQAPASAVQPTEQSTLVSTAQTSVTATVNVTQLNIRLGPGLNYNIATTLNQGSVLTLLGKSTDGNWYEVQLQDGSEGWVFSAYLTTSASVAALPVMQAPTAVIGTALPSVGGSIPLTGATPVPTVVSTAVPVVVLPPATTNPIVVAIANNQAQVTLSNFPAGKPVIATLGALGTTKSIKMSGPTTDSNGSASFSFSMPFSWPDGTPLTQQSLYMTVSTTDGSFSRTLSFPFYSGR